MSDEPISIFSRRPHMAGVVRCLACKHEWAGVAEPGTLDMVCPACECSRGVWKNPIESKVGTMVFRCYCECTAFELHRDGFMCYGCGAVGDYSQLC